MRVQSLSLVAASAALIAPTTFPHAPHPLRPDAPARHLAGDPFRDAPARANRSGVRIGPVPERTAGPPAPPSRSGPDRGPGTGGRAGGGRAPVRAADLLAEVRDCTPVSRGRYREDAGTPADIPVCGKRDAVYWKADLDIDCDGVPGDRCNSRSDPHFSPATAFTRSDGRPLDAERLPYVVVPEPSDVWDHRKDDVRGGSLAAVVHGDRVRYAVVGDVGPADLIGEASYAAAKALGVNADPHGGGAPSDVTYIVFKGSEVEPVEDVDAAEKEGERLVRKFMGGE
ncbi:glycoside hydrolase family 75 protein [Streptomyces parvulus]|uniref:glycoside hydrolase family 75 protein n=1 Tax=Streptomyces TaxID=1883 RepID=UPI001E302CF8|nr:MULTISPECIES: glycoside hydrolase family 75 protein [Streptomyces]MCC9152699.1 glycoside hydrolase family 75 protein [Streptomyces parvulus]MCE7687153.1 glycoside hydrolase family 75 protein [Streptomyces parvulus]WML78864.1 glycoside hydrolase family 75 protein [Streptomyces sp. VNUA74]